MRFFKTRLQELQGMIQKGHFHQAGRKIATLLSDGKKLGSSLVGLINEIHLLEDNLTALQMRIQDNNREALDTLSVVEGNLTTIRRHITKIKRDEQEME